MTYILIQLLVIVVPLAAGLYLAGRRRGGGKPRPLVLFIVMGSLMAGWFVLSWYARGYAETDRTGWRVAEWWAHSGKWYIFGIVMLFVLGYVTRLENTAGARKGVVLCSVAELIIIWTVVWRTIPIYTFLPHAVERDGDGCIRQSVRYTCGPVSLANLMERHLGISDVTERELARLSNTTVEGTTMSGLVRAAEMSGLKVVECRTLAIEELEKNLPAIVFFSSMPGVHHATLLVKLDMETAYFIDPDAGFWKTPRERFKRMWYGKTLVLSK